MSDLDLTPDPNLSPEQARVVSTLSEAVIANIDESLYANTSNDWRKVAKVIGATMSERTNRDPSLPDIYYAQRLRVLVEAGKLDYRGNFENMRYCEVRRVFSELAV